MMERRTDVIYKLIDDVRDRTNEYLQPNPGIIIYICFISILKI